MWFLLASLCFGFINFLRRVRFVRCVCLFGIHLFVRFVRFVRFISSCCSVRSGLLHPAGCECGDLCRLQIQTLHQFGSYLFAMSFFTFVYSDSFLYIPWFIFVGSDLFSYWFVYIRLFLHIAFIFQISQIDFFVHIHQICWPVSSYSFLHIRLFALMS